MRACKHLVTMFLIILLLFTPLASSLINVASRKPYTIDQPGFVEVVFSSHNNQGYTHTTSSAEFLHYGHYLTDDSAYVSTRSILWTNASAFNVSLIIDLETSYSVKEVFVRGQCCNMGIYTPTAIYVSGASSSAGPWTYVGETSGLVSGDDVETPAVRYETHFQVTDAAPWRYIRVLVEGAANKYMSIRNVEIWA